MSKYVLKLLESYNERERKIAVLRYNLEHPAKVSRSEQIEAMNFGHGDGLDHSAGHISNKTPLHCTQLRRTGGTHECRVSTRNCKGTVCFGM